MTDRRVYVVERRIFQASGEHEVVAGYENRSDAIAARDGLGGYGGRITAVPLYPRSVLAAMLSPGRENS